MKIISKLLFFTLIHANIQVFGRTLYLVNESKDVTVMTEIAGHEIRLSPKSYKTVNIADVPQILWKTSVDSQLYEHYGEHFIDDGKSDVVGYVNVKMLEEAFSDRLERFVCGRRYHPKAVFCSLYSVRPQEHLVQSLREKNYSA